MTSASWPGSAKDVAIPTIAVDLPSGVDADTGADPEQSFRATRTVTFGELKPCHLLEPARSRCGEVELVDIGLPDRDEQAPGRWLDQFDALDLVIGWPYPDATSDKYSRGVVGIDTGSDDYPGAGVMSVCGAVYAGAGMVRFLGATAPADLIRSRLPNVVFSPGRVQAHLLGSGWGERADGHRVIADALDSGLPAVVDADGLKYLPDELPPSWLLTPHAGELAKLLDQDRSWVTADPVRAVCAAADRTGATVLLKGATQLVAEPGSPRVHVAVPGPAWTAQAGSGDVLGGICATVLAAGLQLRLRRTVRRVAAGHHRPPSSRVRSRRWSWPSCCRPRSPGCSGSGTRGDRRTLHRPRHGKCRDRPGRVPGQRAVPSPPNPPLVPPPDQGPRRAGGVDGGGQGRRVRPRDAALRGGGADRRGELARRRHTERGAGGSRIRRHRPAARLALRARRRSRSAGRRRRRRLRPVDRPDLPAGGGGRHRRAAGPGAPQDRHRTVPQRRRGRRLGRGLRGGGRGRAVRGARGGRRLVPPRRGRRARTRRRSRSSSRPSSARTSRPGRPDSSRRSATWPTPRPRCCCPRRTSTWSGSVSRRTASIPRRASPPGPASRCVRR